MRCLAASSSLHPWLRNSSTSPFTDSKLFFFGEGATLKRALQLKRVPIVLQTLFCFIFHVFTHYFLVLFSYIVLEMMISLRVLCVDRSCLRIVFKTRPGTSNTHTIARYIATSNSLSLSRRRWLLSWPWYVNAAQMHFLAHVDDAIQGTAETKAQVIRPPRPSPFLPAKKNECELEPSCL